MRVKVAATVVAAVVVASAHGSTLPPPSFRLAWFPSAIAAAGPRVAIVSDNCTILVATLAANSKRVAVSAPRQCRDNESDVALWDLWLGRARHNHDRRTEPARRVVRALDRTASPRAAPPARRRLGLDGQR